MQDQWKDSFVHLAMGSYTAEDIVKEVKILVEDLVKITCFFTGLAADGASVMSGSISGVQALLKETYPWIVCCHCVANRLNLVVVNSLKGACKEVLTIADKLHSLLSSSKTKDVFTDIQRRQSVSILKMPERSETRWSSVFHILDVLYSRYQEILLTLVKTVSCRHPCISIIDD